MSISLSVNLNKIALLRNSRDGNYPNLCEFGERALALGVAGLTVHPRPDCRHIRPSDITSLKTILEKYPDREFNIEGNPFAESNCNYPGFINIVEAAQPHQCTLVPDTDAQLTSDHGFDLTVDGKRLTPIIKNLQSRNIRVALFMDPDIEQIKLAKEVGADRIELYTGPYAQACLKQSSNLNDIFNEYYKAGEYATAIGLGVNAGHDLNLLNLGEFSNVPGLLEVSIGHALMVDALLHGFDKTILDYKTICDNDN